VEAVNGQSRGRKIVDERDLTPNARRRRATPHPERRGEKSVLRQVRSDENDRAVKMDRKKLIVFAEG